MANDIRYSELLFLSALANRSLELFDQRDSEKFKIAGSMYVEMVSALIEDLYVRFRNDEIQLLVAKLRGELSPDHKPPGSLFDYYWKNPRDGLFNVLIQQNLQGIVITYRGLHRIEELRDTLRSERILDPMGVFLSMQYFVRDLEDALKSGPSASVSVLYCDMDNFKRINTEFGHKAGDVVMKSYLEIIRDTLGAIGTGYRGVGDEVAVIIVGQGQDRSIEFAEKIRKGVEGLRCEFNKQKLPSVTASIGVATTPPESRTADIEIAAESRNQQAKDGGKNRVIWK